MKQSHDTFLAKVLLVSVDDIANDYLHVEISHMKELIKKGEFPFITLQGVEMIRMWDLMDYIERNLQRYDPSGQMLKGIRAELKGKNDA